jgi:cellulose biosynthesis protein BcsQ
MIDAEVLGEDLLAEARSIAPDVVELRRRIHRRPELGLRNPETQQRIVDALDGITRGYGVVLVDCPPSLGDLTTNGLAAADQSLIVVEPTALSLRGVAPVADRIERVWERHNGELDLAGVIVNRMPARSNDAALRYDELARTVGTSSVWAPSIPTRVVVAEAAAARRPIHGMGHRGSGVADVFDQLYDQLWERIRPERA